GSCASTASIARATWGSIPRRIVGAKHHLHCMCVYSPRAAGGALLARKRIPVAASSRHISRPVPSRGVKATMVSSTLRRCGFRVATVVLGAWTLATFGCHDSSSPALGSQSSAVCSGGCTYANEVLADSPISYWRLGETSGTTAADQKGTSPGTYV